MASRSQQSISRALDDGFDYFSGSIHIYSCRATAAVLTKTPPRARVHKNMNLLRMHPLHFAALFLLLVSLALAEVPTAPLPDRRLPRAVLVFAEGLGWGAAETGNLGKHFSRLGSVRTPDVDSAGVASRVSTGCDLAAGSAVSSLSLNFESDATGNMPLLAEAFAHKGASVGLVTTKCLDDGSTSPFVARWGDRYDLRNVAARVDDAFRSKTFVHGVGGFSNELRRLRRRPDDDFVFTTDGESVFARRCEYASSGKFESLAVRALERLVAKSPEEHLLVLVHTDVDRAGVIFFLVFS